MTLNFEVYVTHLWYLELKFAVHTFLEHVVHLIYQLEAIRVIAEAVN